MGRCDERAKGVVSALAGATAWGLSGTCVQYLFATTALDPLLLTTIRQLGAAVLFMVALRATQPQALRAMLSDGPSRHRVVIFGVLGLFLNSCVYSAAVQHTNAGTATVLQSLCIVFALALTCARARRMPGMAELAALACALAATLLIATGGDLSSLRLPPLGLLLGIATACAATFYTMYPKPLFERWGSFAATGAGMCAGGLCGLACCLVRAVALDAPGMPSLDVSGVIVLAIAVVVGTFGAYGLFLHGISLVGPVWGNMIGAAEPVSATVLAALWLGTPFTLADWLGLALMVATMALVALPRQAALPTREGMRSGAGGGGAAGSSREG